MEAALYDESEGFYASQDLGPEGHFVTSTHVSPAFGGLVARQLGDAWETLGKPAPFVVIEGGAGDGTLARRILDTVAAVPALAEATTYVCVERSDAARRALAAQGLRAEEALPRVGRSTGCLVANELLDNLPFHLLRERAGRDVEVMVGVEGEGFAWTEGEPSPQTLAALRAPIGRGETRPVSPAVLALVHDVAGVLERGYAFLFDYGFTPGEPPTPLRSYRAQRVLADVLAEPGTRDITAGVDFGALVDEARAAGLQVWGPVTQRDALLALGLEDWLAALRTRQSEAQREGDWRAATRFYDERSRATLLADPDQLGSLKLLVLGTPGLPPPAAVRATR